MQNDAIAHSPYKMPTLVPRKLCSIKRPPMLLFCGLEMSYLTNDKFEPDVDYVIVRWLSLFTSEIHCVTWKKWDAPNKNKFKCKTGCFLQDNQNAGMILLHSHEEMKMVK